MQEVGTLLANVRYCYRRRPAPGDREAAALRVPASQAEAHELRSTTLLLVLPSTTTSQENLDALVRKRSSKRLIKATLATTTVVAVKYDTWSLDALWGLHHRAARSPAGTKFDAVGILDHGAPGRFCLLKSVGGGDIDLADLASSDIAAFLKALGGLVKPGGRIDLLGCSVAAGPEGRALLAQVEALTGVTVTASTDKTGGAEGADWVMETDNLQVIPSYFHADKLGEWKEAAFLFLAAAAARCLLLLLGPRVEMDRRLPEQDR